MRVRSDDTNYCAILIFTPNRFRHRSRFAPAHLATVLERMQIGISCARPESESRKYSLAMKSPRNQREIRSRDGAKVAHSRAAICA